MNSQYAISGSIRYYMPLPRQVKLKDSTVLDIAAPAPVRGDFNLARWKEPPHVALANMRDNPEAALRFTRLYGALHPDYTGEQDIDIQISLVFKFRDSLRHAWDGNYVALSVVVDDVKAEIRLNPTRMEIVPENLWALIRVIFARDFWDRRTGKCENPECPAPYFLLARKGQKFCSQKCSVLISVREFRKRAADKSRKTVQRKKGGK